jgi:uncharacterized peroxidase-related enzyme
MPHIKLPEGFPGIRSLMMFRPETALPLNMLAQVLLHDSNSLSAGERELIATYVSNLNECKYCASCHGAIAKHHLGNNEELVSSVVEDPDYAPVSDKLKALMRIAAKVQKGGKKVRTEDIESAKTAGATDLEIHDAVLIAAAFCMYNRYVDGLASWTPDDPALYDRIGRQRSVEGYMTAPFSVQKTS